MPGTRFESVRGDLALDSSTPELTPLSINAPTSGRTFGIHPGMPEFQSLYNDGDLAFFSNIGTIVRPTTLADYNNESHLPKGLFWHADQIVHWQTSVPDQRIRQGWGGRTADILNSENDATISMNISLRGNNIFQTGNAVFPYEIIEPWLVKRLISWDF